MIPAIDIGKIYSTLGNNSSLVPLAIKDVANSLGLTAGSYMTGDKLEGRDRFIDEFGTQAIWLLGLPVYKKLTDLTFYKALKFDPKADVRILENPEILDKAIELTTGNTIKQSLIKLKNNPKTSRMLALGKFGIATVLTFASYTLLTKYRHNKTKEAAKKEIIQEHKVRKQYSQTSFGQFMQNAQNKQSQNPPFTGAAGFAARLKNFMFDPVKNLMIVDAGITTERLTESRNKQDFIGYTIKEGAFWAFMYLASRPIQKYFENAADKKGTSINLDARIIESSELKNAFSNRELIENSLKNFPIKGSDIEIYEYLHKNPNDFLVQMAKKSDEITTLKNSDIIDSRYFIDIGNYENKTGIKGIYAKIETLYKQYNDSGESLDNFFGKVKSLKRSAVLKNIGICIAALGVVTPLVMAAIRYLSGNKKFQVKEDLAKEFNLNA